AAQMSVRPERLEFLPKALATVLTLNAKANPAAIRTAAQSKPTRAGRRRKVRRVVANINPPPSAKHAREVAESAILRRTRQNNSNVVWAISRFFRSRLFLVRHNRRSCQNVPIEITRRTTPKTFLLVVIPVFTVNPSGVYPRPRSVYLMNSKESGNKTKPARDRSRLIAAVGSGSVTTTSIMTRSLVDRIQRFAEISG